MAGVWAGLTETERQEHQRWISQFIKHDDGRVEVTTGSYLTGPEQVGGYYIIEMALKQSRW